VSVYSINLFTGLPPGGDGVVYTVPVNQVVVVREIDLLNYSGEVASTQVQVTVPGSGSATLVFENELANLTTYQWQGRAVIPSGSTIVFSATYQEVQALICGYLLGAPA
jgi:hypothetical protein